MVGCRVLVALAMTACGRIGFDAGTGPPDGGVDAPPFACTGAPTASDPPASGGSLTLVRSFGRAPNAPPGTPNTDSVEISWEPRALTTTGTYGVVRGVCGIDVDLATMLPCTADTVEACLACVTTDTRCNDVAAPPSPAVARYHVVVRDGNGQPTPQPDDADFVVDVAIPPPNMVLMHRASVNREMCDLLGSATVATAHHSCPHVGPGGVPSRAHPDSPDLVFAAGIYDFGYDLFVDRWETGCNWTHAADGGKCGVGGAAGDCVSNDGPSGGVPGNVFYSTFDGRCYLRDPAGWTPVFALTDDLPALAAFYTNDPGPARDRPPLTHLFLPLSASLCSTSSVATYGSKRLLRLREFVAAGAFSRLATDPDRLSAAQITEIENGLSHSTTQACNVRKHDGVMPAGFGSGDELARDIVIIGDFAEAPDMFVLGSSATARCASRYGIQDLIGNIYEVVSDQFASCGTTTPCTGMVSSVDAGNADLVGFTLDGTTGFGPTFDTKEHQSAPRVLIPLAMPLAASAPFGTTPDVNQLRGDFLGLYSDSPDHTRMAIAGGHHSNAMAAGRFTVDFGGEPSGGNSDVTWGMRCAVAATPR